MTDEMSLAIFDPIKVTLVKLVERDKSLVFDHTTPDGETGLRSWVNQLRGYKGDVARAHKDTKAKALAFGRQVDAVKNELIATVDKIITERMKPLDEIKAKKKEADTQALEALLESRRIAEQERLDAIAKQEAELAVKQAGIKAEEDKLVREREQLEAEKRAEEDAKRREQQARKQAEEKAEREKQEAIAKAEREKQAFVAAADKILADLEAGKERAKKEAVAKMEAAIEAEQEKARQVERERIAKEEAEVAFMAKELKAEKKRVANLKHRKSIEDCICEDIDKITDNSEMTNNIVDAIKAGQIQNVTINY